MTVAGLAFSLTRQLCASFGKMQLSHLLILRVLIIILSLALVGLTFVHHHQKGQITVFLICEVGIAVLLVAAAATFGYLW